MKNIIAILAMLIVSVAYSQSVYPDNEDGAFADMLTPGHYHSARGDSFRVRVNAFVHFARMERFHHPFADSTGQMPPYSIPPPGVFGAGKGPGGTQEHHAATDMHVGDNETNVAMYAAHDGYVSTHRDAPKYRNYLSITKEIYDSTGRLLGKISTLYAHIDLALDSTDNIVMNGKYVKKGDLVSRHFYAGTRGGPHLHFEIRYYRPGDAGDETFYGWVGPAGSRSLTEPSAGPWSYGYWNPDIGYGFANPANHVQELATGVGGTNGALWGFRLYQNYPNPFNPGTTIAFSLPVAGFVNLTVYNALGKKIEILIDDVLSAGFHKATFNAVNLASGLYFYKITTSGFVDTKQFLLLR